MKLLKKLTALVMVTVLLLTMIPLTAQAAGDSKYLVTRKLGKADYSKGGCVEVGDTCYVLNGKVYDMNGKHIFSVKSGEEVTGMVGDRFIVTAKDGDYVYTVNTATGTYKKNGPYLEAVVMEDAGDSQWGMICAGRADKNTIFTKTETIKLPAGDISYAGDGMLMIYENVDTAITWDEVSFSIYNVATKTQTYLDEAPVLASFDGTSDYGTLMYMDDNFNASMAVVDKSGNVIFEKSSSTIVYHLGGGFFLRYDYGTDKTQVITKSGKAVLTLSSSQDASVFVAGQQEYIIVVDYNTNSYTVYKADSEAESRGVNFGPFKELYCFGPDAFYVTNNTGSQYKFYSEGGKALGNDVYFDGNSLANGGKGVLVGRDTSYASRYIVKNNDGESLATFINLKAISVAGDGVFAESGATYSSIYDGDGNRLLSFDSGVEDAYVHRLENGNMLVLAKCEDYIDVYFASWQATPFVDVKDSDWFGPAVAAMRNSELMVGVSDTKFAPNNDVTRYEFVAILYRLNGSPKVTGEMPFSDVQTGQWYSNAVLWAVQNNIVAGYSDGKFHGTDRVTREQTAAFLYRYSARFGGDTGGRADLSSFADASKVQSWSRDAIAWAVSEGLIYGTQSGGKTNLSPTDTCTRAQAAAIISRYND